MRIVETHSHNYGEEYLRLHRPALIHEIHSVIESIDGQAFSDRVSGTRDHSHKPDFSKPGIHEEMVKRFRELNWKEHRRAFWVTSDWELTKTVARMPLAIQRRAIQLQGADPISVDLGFDNFKERVGIHLQLDSSSSLAHAIFVNLMNFYVSDAIDVGIEILPMKELETQMSSGVPYYERDLLNIIRQGRGVPAVPLVLIGIAP